MKSKKINRMKESILSEADFRPESVKERVNMLVAENIVNEYRRRAAELGIGYQTLMQINLAKALQIPDIEERVAKLEKKRA